MTDDQIVVVVALAILVCVALFVIVYNRDEDSSSAFGGDLSINAGSTEEWEERYYPGISKVDAILERNLRQAHDVSEIRFDRLAGCSHPNRDGSSRRRYIERCDVFEDLEIRLEPDNPVDPLALAVHRLSGEQLGYIPRSTAKLLRKDAGRPFTWKILFRHATRFPDRNHEIAGAAIYLVRVALAQPPEPDWRWTMNIGTYLMVSCPRCQARIGMYCQSRSGAEVFTPHASRVKAFQEP